MRERFVSCTHPSDLSFFSCSLFFFFIFSVECRNVLKYTYVFAYYLPDGPEKTLFEFLQQQLEASNETLSELSELPPIDKLDRTQIVNYTRITNQFMNNLLTGVAAGLTPH